jgi:hypothetical protein
MKGNSVPASESPEYRRRSDELAQAQADLSRQLEQRRHRHRLLRRAGSDPRMWGPKWIFVPAATAFVVLQCATSLGPSLAAAEGHGTAGYFVAETEHCSQGTCGWGGDFVTPDGRVTLHNVHFMGTHGTLYQGARLAALDTGSHGEVYPRHGSHEWMADLAGIVIGAIVLGLWAWRVPYRTARRAHRIRLDNWLIGQDGSPR